MSLQLAGQGLARNGTCVTSSLGSAAGPLVFPGSPQGMFESGSILFLSHADFMYSILQLSLQIRHTGLNSLHSIFYLAPTFGPSG